MNPNPLLKKLGFAADDRVAIVHADDLGICQAALPAFVDLIEAGLVSCGAVMVPCPWFPQVAAYARGAPQIDLGVHLTLNSEWDACRWGPLSTRDPASGLLDAEGYFPRESEAVQAQANPDAVRLELQTQIERALQAGIDVTHIDTHKGTVAHPKFVPGYVQLATHFRLPPMMLRLDQAGWLALGLDAGTAALAAALAPQLEEQGLPLLDHMVMLPLDQPHDRLELAKRTFEALPPGVTHFIIHPAQDTPELRALAPTDWPSRVADYQTFTNPELRAFVRNAGIQVIGYRAVREAMRAGG